MKPKTLPACLGISFLFHMAGIGGLVMLGGFARLPTGPPSSEAMVTIITAEAREDVAALPQPVAIPTPPPEPERLKTVEPASIVAKVEERVIMASTNRTTAETKSEPLPSGDSIVGRRPPEPRPEVLVTLTPSASAARPAYLKNPEPPYPVSARRRHKEGLVLLAVKVNAQGGPESVEIKKTSGFSLLDEAARKTVRNWEFEPARIGGQTMESEVEVPVRFKLAD